MASPNHHSWHMPRKSGSVVEEKRKIPVDWLPLPNDRKSTKEELVSMVLELYWDAAFMELRQIVISLSELQDETASIEQQDDNESLSGGYHSFIDQIGVPSLSGRTLNAHNWRRGDPQQPLSFRYAKSEDGKAVADAVTDKQKDLQQNLKIGHANKQLRRARLFLQAAGFLDVDKLIEYRHPIEKIANIPVQTLGIVSKGMKPQLEVNGWTKDSLPQFQPAKCSICPNILRGTMFRCARDGCRKPGWTGFVCEDCFRLSEHPQDHLTKIYKHCILDQVITPQISRKLCQCTDVSRFDLDGNSVSLWPIQSDVQHRSVVQTWLSRCRLFHVPGLAAAAIANELENPLERRGNSVKQVTKRIAAKATSKARIYSPEDRLEEAINAGFPIPLRPLASNFPAGNTHVALAFGPLIIENGVPDTKRGVLISCRKPLSYFAGDDASQDVSSGIILSHDRKIYHCPKYPRRDRRLKACMKQVVGKHFSYNFLSDEEDEFVWSLVEESKMKQTRMRDNSKFDRAAARLVEKLKNILLDKVNQYLHLFLDRLFDPHLELEWQRRTNNCQIFCDNILQHVDFKELLGSNNQSLDYLMSFVVRPQTYRASAVKSIHDVPNGLIEEYLEAFRQGRHDDADIIETLSEYWYDFGAFGKHLYQHQDLFPWDCTEAYQEGCTKCGSCSLAKHVWAFPFDAWSIIQLHLHRDRRWYLSHDEKRARMTDKLWMENRLKLLQAKDALMLGAGAMSSTPLFRDWSSWLSNCQVSYDRVKLAGIHRAQPYSHHFEMQHYVQFLLAPWIHLPHSDRIAAYESLRETRKRALDPSTKGGTWDFEDENMASSFMFWSTMVPDIVLMDGWGLDNTTDPSVSNTLVGTAILDAIGNISLPNVDDVSNWF